MLLQVRKKRSSIGLALGFKFWLRYEANPIREKLKSELSAEQEVGWMKISTSSNSTKKPDGNRDYGDLKFKLINGDLN